LVFRPSLPSLVKQLSKETMSQPALTKPGLSRVSLIFACGTALFSDGYANGNIGTVVSLIKIKYGKAAVNAHHFSDILNSLTFAGTIVGMLTFGYISDKVGRKFGMMAATAIVAVFSLLSAAIKGVNGDLHSMLAQLAAWRFLLGIGVGAEYPCGSVAASEQSEEQGIEKNAQHRWFALATNTMIDFGFVIAAFIPLLLLWIFKEEHINTVWRGTLGLGLFPAVAVFIWRLRMEEPSRFKRDSMKNTRIPYLLIFKRYWVRWLAISTTWFIYDFITYPFGLYTTTVLTGVNAGESLTTTLGWNVVINLFYIPGTVIGAFCVDYIGPKYCQILGLIAQAIIGFIMSGAYAPLVKHVGAFAVVYGIFLTCGEFGPGNCLGMLAAKSGPTAVRGQFYGAAAAVGKVGAFVGIWAFPPMINAFSRNGTDPDRGNTGPFWIGSAVAILSALITFFFIHPLSHDGMEKEDMEFRLYLQENGFDTSKMGLLDETEIHEVEEKVQAEEGHTGIECLDDSGSLGKEQKV